MKRRELVRRTTRPAFLSDTFVRNPYRTEWRCNDAQNPQVAVLVAQRTSTCQRRTRPRGSCPRRATLGALRLWHPARHTNPKRSLEALQRLSAVKPYIARKCRAWPLCALPGAPAQPARSHFSSTCHGGPSGRPVYASLRGSPTWIPMLTSPVLGNPDGNTLQELFVNHCLI